jgi:hypothetical protein
MFGKKMLVWLISHQPTVHFSRNKPATNNQPAVLFSQNKSAPAISHQPNEQAKELGRLFALCTHHSQNWQSNKFRPAREIDFGMTNLAKQHFCKNSVCTSSLEFQIKSVQFVLHSEHFRFSKT